MSRQIFIDVLEGILDKDTLDFMCCPLYRKGLFDRFVRSLSEEDKQSLVKMNFNALNHLIGNALAKPFIETIHSLYDTLQFAARNKLVISGIKLTARNVDGEIRNLLSNPTESIIDAIQKLTDFLELNELTNQIYRDLPKLVYFAEAFRKFSGAGQTDEKIASAITSSGGPLDSKHNSIPLNGIGSPGRSKLVRTTSFKTLSDLR